MRNAASNGTSLAPGTIFSLYGTSLTDGRTLSATAVPLPRTLAGATVRFGTIDAPIFYASPTQVNGQVPWEVPISRSASVQVRVQTANGAASSPIFDVTVSLRTPGIFTLNQTGNGPGVILRGSDYQLYCPQGRQDCPPNPARPGDVLVIYATGLGPVSGTLSTGAPATQALPTTQTPAVKIGGIPATVLYSGTAVNFVGLYQLNVLVPNRVPPGSDATVEMSFLSTTSGIGSTDSNSVTLATHHVLPQGGGPSGGRATALAIDPADGSHLWSGSSAGGVFVSRDGARSWVGSSQGLSNPNVAALAIDPANSDVAYAAVSGAGAYKTTDGGASWVAANAGLQSASSSSLVSIAVDPTNSSNVLAGGAGILYSSTDGAATWRVAYVVRSGTNPLPSGAAISSVRHDRREPGNVYIATSGSGVHKSIDGGNTWVSANNGLLSRESQQIESLEFDPSDASILYAETRDGLYRTTNAAANWTRLGSNRGFFSMVILATTPPTFVGAGLYIETSVDGGLSWTRQSSEFLNGTRILVNDPTNPSNVYGLSFPGIWKSTDRGRTWVDVSTGLTNSYIYSISVSSSDPANILTVADYRLRRSRNHGESWETVVVQSPDFFSPATVAMVPGDPSRVLASGFSGLFLSSDGGVSWRQVSDRGGQRDFAFDPRNSSIVYTVDVQGGVLRSTDGGGSWSLLGTGIGSFDQMSVVAVDPLNPTILFAGTLSQGLYRSKNSGATWERINAGLSTPFTSSPIAIWSVAIDPTDSNRIFVGTFRGGVFLSTDGGDNWRHVGKGMETASVWSLVLDPFNLSRLYAASEGGGLCKSLDGAATWLPMGSGMENVTVRTLNLDPSSPSILYAGTDRGVYKSVDAGESWFPTGAY